MDSMIIFVCMAMMNLNNEKPVLPAVWDKDFSITLYEGGGMINRSTHITYTYDSCIYDYQQNKSVSTKNFALTATDRETILTKLKSLKLEKLKTAQHKHAIPDKGTVSLCFINGSRKLCLEDSASGRVIDTEGAFTTAYQYLKELAMKRQ
jgi:hypothetical protein